MSTIKIPNALTSVRAIHQFHPAVSQGDAITDDLLCLQEIIQSWGFKSDIYCQYPTSGIVTKPFRDYISRSHPDNLLLLHFSIAYSEDVLKYIDRLPDCKILVYHNIVASGDAFSTTPTNLNAELAYIKQSGVTVKTVQQALTEVMTQ